MGIELLHVAISDSFMQAKPVMVLVQRYGTELDSMLIAPLGEI